VAELLPRAETGWDPHVAHDLVETEPPGEEALRVRSALEEAAA
jgi:hypothetical protein